MLSAPTRYKKRISTLIISMRSSSMPSSQQRAIMHAAARNLVKRRIPERTSVAYPLDLSQLKNKFRERLLFSSNEVTYDDIRFLVPILLSFLKRYETDLKADHVQKSGESSSSTSEKSEDQVTEPSSSARSDSSPKSFNSGDSTNSESIRKNLERLEQLAVLLENGPGPATALIDDDPLVLVDVFDLYVNKVLGDHKNPLEFIQMVSRCFSLNLIDMICRDPVSYDNPLSKPDSESGETSAKRKRE